MKTEERDFTKAVIALAEINHWMVMHVQPGMSARGRWITTVNKGGKGFPDLVMVKDGMLVFVELKTPTGEMSDEQIVWMSELFRTGVRCMCWTPSHLEKIKEFLCTNHSCSKDG